MGWKLILSSVLALIMILLTMFYFLPFNEINFETKSANYNFSMFPSESGMQFYPNMRFPDTTLTYRILDCPLQKTDDMETAFDIMGNLTLLKFDSVSNNEQISVTCEEQLKMSKGGMFTAGEGGPTNITKAGEFYVILSGSILLIKESNCPTPNIALHELFHVLGFDHSTNPNNVMYNFTSCDQTIGEDMVQLINDLYSIPSYPDLILENVSAVMNGRFLDVNLTVLNIGLADAPKSKIIIYADGNQIKEVNLESIGLGYGRIMTLGNIWVSQINVNELNFILKNDFNEINKENNKIKLKVR